MPKQRAFLAMLAVLADACGGQASTTDRKSPPPSTGGNRDTEQHAPDGSPAGTGGDGGEPATVDAAPRCIPGEERKAMPGEGAAYCICPEDTSLWTCYGPDPTRSGDTDVGCETEFSIGSTSEGCTQSYSSCDDGRTYVVSCASGFCVCAIDSETVAALEPGATCPDSLSDANELCGWELSGTL